MVQILHYDTLRTLNYGIYGMLLIMGSAAFISSALVRFGSGFEDWINLQAPRRRPSSLGGWYL